MRGRSIRLPFSSGALSSGAAMLAIRVVMGPMLAYHGYRKIEGGVGNFVETVDGAGFPLPELLARGTIAVELLGGICLTVGLLTRLWGSLAAVQFLLIVTRVKWDAGLLGPPGRTGFELDLLYLVTATALLMAGPGLLALDRLLGLEAGPDRAAALSGRDRQAPAEA